MNTRMPALFCALLLAMSLSVLGGCAGVQDDAAESGVRIVEMSIDGERPPVGSTQVPYEVWGVDAQGNEVSLSGYTGFGISAIELAPGEYTVHFPASPLCPDGSYYALPPDLELAVEEGDPDKAIEINFNLYKMSLYSVTDEMLGEALEYAKGSPVNADKAQSSYEKTMEKQPIEGSWEKLD